MLSALCGIIVDLGLAALTAVGLPWSWSDDDDPPESPAERKAS